MDVLDIIGPIMIVPSSSHTAGTVQIGRIARRLLGQDAVAAELALAGSESAIPADEVIEKETAEGGLSATPTGRALFEQVFGNHRQKDGHGCDSCRACQ